MSKNKIQTISISTIVKSNYKILNYKNYKKL